MTVDRLLKTISSYELMEWGQYFSLKAEEAENERKKTRDSYDG